ncbi:extracellular solute-binding protein [Hungatella sp.]|uniref:extracellular solute-binding protein n=1 Tax=Hungatella sp. TaxID=2613924 RepID=UPI0039938AB9
MRKRRTAAWFMAAAMVMGSLAGCGQKAAPETTAAQNSEAKKEETAASEETKAEAESTGEQVELKVFGFKTGAEEGAIPELIEQFNKENPDIKVVYEGISNAGGYQDVLTARLASGPGDDVFFANPNSPQPAGIPRICPICLWWRSTAAS